MIPRGCAGLEFFPLWSFQMKHFLLIGAMTKSSILGYFFNPRVILPFFFQNTQDLKTKKYFRLKYKNIEIILMKYFN